MLVDHLQMFLVASWNHQDLSQPDMGMTYPTEWLSKWLRFSKNQHITKPQISGAVTSPLFWGDMASVIPIASHGIGLSPQDIQVHHLLEGHAKPSHENDHQICPVLHRFHAPVFPKTNATRRHSEGRPSAPTWDSFRWNLININWYSVTCRRNAPKQSQPKPTCNKLIERAKMLMLWVGLGSIWPRHTSRNHFKTLAKSLHSPWS